MVREWRRKSDGNGCRKRGRRKGKKGERDRRMEGQESR
jgi:hypothetical protein